MPTVAATSTASRSQRDGRWPDRAIYSAFGSTGYRVLGLVETSSDQITDALNDCDFKSAGKKLSCQIVPDP